MISKTDFPVFVLRLFKYKHSIANIRRSPPVNKYKVYITFHVNILKPNWNSCDNNAKYGLPMHELICYVRRRYQIRLYYIHRFYLTIFVENLSHRIFVFILFRSIWIYIIQYIYNIYEENENLIFPSVDQCVCHECEFRKGWGEEDSINQKIHPDKCNCLRNSESILRPVRQKSGITHNYAQCWQDISSHE